MTQSSPMDFEKEARELESAITKVGRQRVFDRARTYGWSEGGAPTFVWWGIVREIQNEAPPSLPRS